MAEYRDTQRNREGLSVRQLILLFLAGVAVCAVFFALGFVVGYNNQRTPAFSAETERVTGAGSVIPPTVNPPIENDQAPGTSTAKPAANSAEPQTEQVSPPQAAPRPAEAPGRTRKTPSPPAASVEPSGARVEPVARTASNISLQVVASSSKKDAQNVVSKLKARGYPAFLMTPQDAHASDNLFRVEVGPFSTRLDAEKVRKKLSDDGFQPFVRH